MGADRSQGASSQRASFATTHWTTVLAAGKGDAPDARAALERLCATYWYPLYAYVRRRGYVPADAEDLVQGFFERLLRLESLGRVKQERGRFRSFLLASLNHYIADEWDKSSAAKRDARRVMSLDAREAETWYQREVADEQTPETLYMRRWAIALLQSVLEQLAGEYEAGGKRQLFMQLRFALSGEKQKVPYAQLANELGMSEPAVRVAVHRLRRRYREILRLAIAQTVAGEEEIEEELTFLMQALSGARG
jgi:RNA polymerase sigma factor (sigma-70 family)